MTSLTWWGLLFGLCICIELSSPGYFFFLSFSAGALAAGIVTLFNGTSAVQGGVFLGVAALVFLMLRRYAAKLAQEESLKTNVYALQGKKGVVLEQIDPYTRGWIKVDGEIWAAVPCDETPIEKGALIEVVDSAGSHLKVKKIAHLQPTEV